MTFRRLSVEDLENPELQAQVNALFPQLTEFREPLSLARVLKEPGSVVLVVCEEAGRLLGMAAIANYTVISGRKGWIEDVVVDREARGRGIGRSLMKRLLEVAAEQGLTEVLLFTGFKRQPAITLYESLGFSRKDSYLYHLKLG